jgi:hypothetical protein
LLLSNELMGRLLREFWQIVGRHHLRALIHSNFQLSLVGIFQCHEVNIIHTISWFYWICSKSINKISHICLMCIYSSNLMYNFMIIFSFWKNICVICIILTMPFDLQLFSRIGMKGIFMKNLKQPILLLTIFVDVTQPIYVRQHFSCVGCVSCELLASPKNWKKKVQAPSSLGH